MKVAVAACNNHINSNTASKFTECTYFIVVNIYDLSSYDIILNPYNKMTDGADIYCANLIVNRGVDALIIGNCTPNAIRIFQAAGIKVYQNIYRRVLDNINALKKRELKFNSLIKH